MGLLRSGPLVIRQKYLIGVEMIMGAIWVMLSIYSIQGVAISILEGSFILIFFLSFIYTTFNVFEGLLIEILPATVITSAAINDGLLAALLCVITACLNFLIAYIRYRYLEGKIREAHVLNSEVWRPEETGIPASTPFYYYMAWITIGAWVVLIPSILGQITQFNDLGGFLFLTTYLSVGFLTSYYVVQVRKRK
ncbi:MAG: hypothetical protein ACFFFG_14950 [Candidatus Thorarchaeota archaeon]